MTTLYSLGKQKMKMVESSVEYWGQPPGYYPEVLEFIERCARICYKSEDKIAPGMAEPFVKKLAAAGHTAVLEHSNFVVKLPGAYKCHSTLMTHLLGPGRFLTLIGHKRKDFYYLGGNLTAWYHFCQEWPESRFAHDTYWPVFGAAFPFLARYAELFGLEKQLDVAADYGQEVEYIVGDKIPKELRRYTVKVVCDRGVSHELVRHRVASFAQESTRYCNYGGKDIEFIKPWWWDSSTEDQQFAFRKAVTAAELFYNDLLGQGMAPQAARAVLPNALKTELVITADEKEWQHIFKLRCSAKAHPDMVIVAYKAKELLWTNLVS